MRRSLRAKPGAKAETSAKHGKWCPCRRRRKSSGASQFARPAGSAGKEVGPRRAARRLGHTRPPSSRLRRTSRHHPAGGISRNSSESRGNPGSFGRSLDQNLFVPRDFPGVWPSPEPLARSHPVRVPRPARRVAGAVENHRGTGGKFKMVVGDGFEPSNS